jgi:hypothetical protein
MRTVLYVAAVTLLLGAGAACTSTPEAPPDADTVLHRMSDALSAAQRVSISARREADPDVRQGRDLPALTTINVQLARPDRIRVDLDGGADHRAMYSDGKTFTLQDVTKNIYSTVPLKSTLDDLDDQLDRVYGFVPPMFEFVTNNPYESIHARVNGVTSLGEAADRAGMRCYRVSATGELADAELWLSTTDFLPRQLIATFRNIASHPQIRLYFSSWNLKATFNDSELAFVAPPKAMKIPMRSIAEMKAMIGKEK